MLLPNESLLSLADHLAAQAQTGTIFPAASSVTFRWYYRMSISHLSIDDLKGLLNDVANLQSGCLALMTLFLLALALSVRVVSRPALSAALRLNEDESDFSPVVQAFVLSSESVQRDRGKKRLQFSRVKEPPLPESMGPALFGEKCRTWK